MKCVLAFAFLALFASVASAQTICDKYSAALSLTNSELVTSVVVDTFTLAVADGSSLKKFFDGTLPNTKDFVTNATAQGILVDHLVQFFGAALGCSDGTIGPYVGNDDMEEVHVNLPITYKDFFDFNAALLSVLDTAGVEDADLQIVRTVLDSQHGQICNQADCLTICNKYSAALSLDNDVLIGTVVDGTVGLVTADGSRLKKFFDGSVPNRAGEDEGINFLDPNNAAELATLKLHLVQFFGSALGCSDGTVGPYQGNDDMEEVHEPMEIEEEDFDQFNKDLLSVMDDAGVAKADLDATLAVLETTRNAICNQCDNEPTDDDTTGGGNNGAGLVVPALFSLLPLLAFLF